MLQKRGSESAIGARLINCTDRCFCTQNPSIPFKKADKIAFILNVRDNHWIAIDCDINNCVIRVFNSMISGRMNWNTKMENVTGTTEKLLITSGRGVTNDAWRIDIQKIPQQMGGDCEMFALMHLEYLVFRKDPNLLTQSRITEFRKRKVVDFYRWRKITSIISSYKDEEQN